MQGGLHPDRRQGRSAAESLGRFDVITIGRALHWMDRDAIAALLPRLVAPRWHDRRLFLELRRGRPQPLARWLQRGEARVSAASSGRHREALAAVLEVGRLRQIDQIAVETSHEISVSDLARRVLTFSTSSPAVLGDRAEAMLRDVGERLLPLSRDGLLNRSGDIDRENRPLEPEPQQASLAAWGGAQACGFPFAPVSDIRKADKFLRQPVSSMPIPLPGIRVAIVAATALLAVAPSAPAQQPLTAPQRPAAVAPRPVTAAPKAAAAPALRGGAACHGGMPFDRFLADLKQKAVAGGVSQRALAEASPGMVYDQGIVNRDRRPARVRAGIHGIRRPHGRTLPDAAGPGADQDLSGRVRARRKGIWRTAGGNRGVLGAGKRFRRQHGQPADAALTGVAGL